MEINITAFFKNANPSAYSASIAERGDNAAAETWRAAIEATNEYPLLKTEELGAWDEEKIAAFREYAAEFGAWDEEEIAKWTPTECNALLVQMISGDMREVGMDAYDWDWIEYERGCEAGEFSSRIFGGDDGEVYYYVGM